MITLTIYGCIIFLFAVGIFRYPSIALAAILLMFGLEQWAQSSSDFFVSHNTLTNYIIGAIVLLALVMKIFKGDPVLQDYPAVGLIVLLLFVYAFLSITWVSIPETSYALWHQSFPYIVLILLISPFLFSRIGDLSVTLFTLVLIGALLIALLLFDSNWTYRGVALMGPRGEMLMGNPLAVAEMGGYVMLAAAFMAGGQALDVRKGLMWFFMAAGMALAVKSGSRGQFFGMVISFMAFYPLVRRKQSLAGYLFLFFGFVGFGVLGFWIFELFAANGDARWHASQVEHSAFGRWTGALRLLNEWYSSSPGTIMFGLGNSASFDPKLLGVYPHIVPIEILGEEGLLGFFLFSIIVTLTVRNIIEMNFRLCREEKEKNVALTMSAISFFLFILAFKQGSMLGSLPFFASTIYVGKLRNILRKNQITVAGDI